MSGLRARASSISAKTDYDARVSALIEARTSVEQSRVGKDNWNAHRFLSIEALTEIVAIQELGPSASDRDREYRAQKTATAREVEAVVKEFLEIVGPHRLGVTESEVIVEMRSRRFKKPARLRGWRVRIGNSLAPPTLCVLLEDGRVLDVYVWSWPPHVDEVEGFLANVLVQGGLAAELLGEVE